MSETLRERRDRKHEELRSQTLQMGASAVEMVRLAVEAACEGSMALADRVIELDDQIDRQEALIIKDAIAAVALESPVASDLRFLVSTLGIVGEIEKVGDHAVKLSRRLKNLHGTFPSDLKLSLHRLGEEARHVFAGGLRLYVEYDAELAREIIKGDKLIDRQYNAARRLVWDRISREPAEAETLIRSLSVFHALEHVADHAVEVARRLRSIYEEES